MIANFFVEKGIIKSEEHEIYVYGAEALFSGLSNLLILIICGILMDELLIALLFFSVFNIMRKYCGGYHAATHLKCNLIFTLNTLTILLLIKNYSFISEWLMIIAIIVSDIIIFWLAPIENVNKSLEKYEKKKYRKIAIIFSVIFTIIAVLLIPFNKIVSIMISLTLLSVSFAMLCTKIIKEGGIVENESEKNDL